MLNTAYRAKITALGTYVPPRILTNQDLSKMVETNDEWIVSRTGIRERHIADKGVAASDLAVEAAKQALNERGISANEIDCIVVGTVTPDMLYPSTACFVQKKLGIPNTWGYDLSAGCSGFLFALTAGAQFVMSGVHKKVLVIGSDVNSMMVDYTDRAVCVLFGDGAGAVILERCEDGEDGIMDFIHQVEGDTDGSLCMPAGGSACPASHETVDKKMHYIHQDGQTVFKYAVRKMADLTEEVLRRNGLSGNDIGALIPHQANKRIIDATANRIKIDPAKVIINIDRFGNTTAGTIPLAMQTAREEGRLKKGDLVVLCAVGAGFTSGATLLRWAI